MNLELTDKPIEPPEPVPLEQAPRSLKEILDQFSGRQTAVQHAQQDSGLAEILPFPFLAIVGQLEMKYALLLALINPAIGGVLLLGPRGTGKTTAVRGLIDLLPETPRSLCYYGCLPEDVESGGLDAVCPNCAKKYALGEPLAMLDQVRLVELPLNARLDDVVGVVDETNSSHARMRLHRGILSHADRNLLLVDEVNLLADEVVDAILDAASNGSFTLKRSGTSATYRSRFTLVGTMNPEEGHLRPQIMDRFGLRVIVRGLEDRDARFTAYQHVQRFLTNPRQVMLEYKEATIAAQIELQAARDMLPEVQIPVTVSRIGLELIQSLKIDSLRAEITLFEASRAFAALDGRHEVTVQDLVTIAPLALRLRRSTFMQKYLAEQITEDDEIVHKVKQAK